MRNGTYIRRAVKGFLLLLPIAACLLASGCEDDDTSVSWCYRTDGLTICGDNGCATYRDRNCCGHEPECRDCCAR